MKQLEELIAISRKYGADSRFVIAGGGNTSYKDAQHLWVKASGHALATIDENGFAVLDRAKLAPMGEKAYSADPAQREAQEIETFFGKSNFKGRNIKTFYSYLLERRAEILQLKKQAGVLSSTTQTELDYIAEALALFEHDDRAHGDDDSDDDSGENNE